MDISALRNISSGVIQDAVKTGLKTDTVKTDNNAFGNMLTAAMSNLSTTNAYLSDAENEEIKWALGETENTHDLTNALQKASVSLQYTVAVRDKLLEAYKEIMQIQI